MGFRRKRAMEDRFVNFLGLPPGACSFFDSIPKVMFRCKGSALGDVWFEALLTAALSVAAILINERVYTTPEEVHVQGHQIFGVMLAFLVVFRSQIAWGMYSEGRDHLGHVITATRDLGLEVIATLCAQQISAADQVSGARTRQRKNSVGTPEPESPEPESLAASRATSREVRQSSLHISRVEADSDARVLHQEDNLILAFEVVRMLKLFYFCMCEHLYSTEGSEAWAEARGRVEKFATDNELSEMSLEYGDVQPKNKRRPVQGEERFTRHGGHNDVLIKWRHDPARSKPLLVLSWVRMTLERGVNEGWLRATQLQSFSAGTTDLIAALGGVHKVSNMVLPFPHAQCVATPMRPHPHRRPHPQSAAGRAFTSNVLRLLAYLLTSSCFGGRCAPPAPWRLRTAADVSHFFGSPSPSLSLSGS